MRRIDQQLNQTYAAHRGTIGFALATLALIGLTVSAIFVPGF